MTKTKMTGCEFRKLLLDELAKLGYRETYYQNSGLSTQMIGHHYGSCVPTNHTCWSAVVELRNGKVVVTVPMLGEQDTESERSYLFKTSLRDPLQTTHRVIRWLRTTRPEFRLLPENFGSQLS